VIVDGHNLLWRAAFGFPTRIMARSGKDRTAEFGFFALLRSAARRIVEPLELVVCFDGQYGLDSRTRIDDQYKSNRVGTDLTPIKALPNVKAGLSLQRVQWFEFDDVECDDLVCTLIAENANRQCYILSTDKDYYQLVGPTVTILDSTRSVEACAITATSITERFGVTPAQWCDYRALTGDASDNIKGVAGVGPKTAAKLLANGMTLDDLPTSGRLRGAAGERITAEWTRVLQNRVLLRLRADLPNCLDVAGRVTDQLLPAPKVLEHLQLWS
jgi:DNA polymerase-1